jgi:hypothetical protein
MTNLGVRKSNRFPGLAIALRLLNASRSTVIQSPDRGVYEIGLRITKRLASGCIGAIGIADNSVSAVGRWPSVRFMRDDAVHLLVRPSAKVLDKIARFIGFDRGFGAADHGDSLVRLCQGVAAQPQINWTGVGTANAKCGGRDTVGRST